MTISKWGLRRLLLPAFVAVLATVAAGIWVGQTTDNADAAPTALTIGLDFKTTSGAAGTYDINALPAFENCVDVKTSVDSFFYFDFFVLNGVNLQAFQADFIFNAAKMQILEANGKKLFGTSSTIGNYSTNVTDPTSSTVNPGVSNGIYAGNIVDIGSGHTGSGVLMRFRAQAFNLVSVINFQINVNPAFDDGVTLADSAANHPGDTVGNDGLFDGPFINQAGTIAVNQPDTDTDTVSNTCDNCPNNSNTTQVNTDGDSMGDACDPDDDNDGICDPGQSSGTCTGSDNCQFVYNPTQNASACADGDGDGVLDGNDNCPTTSNANQANYDGDSQGDVCDTDDDNDTVPDSTDNCDFAANVSQANWNGNALGDACEDSDLDNWLDSADNCKSLANPSQTNTDSDNFGDICDNCPTKANNAQTDTDADLIGDACDDSDGDVWMDDVEIYVTTKIDQRCPATTTRNDENPDSWPPDLDDNRLINGQDIIAFSAAPNFAFGKSIAQYPNLVRFDLNMSGLINGQDIIKVTAPPSAPFGSTCTYP